MTLSEKLERIGKEIVDSAYRVHRELGPGLLESVYEDEVIVENKAVVEMYPLFESQLLTYLKLSRKRLGYLINYNVPLIKTG